MQPDEEPFVTITTTCGAQHTLRVEIPLGSPENPVSDEALTAKYRSLALMVWPENATDALPRQIMSLTTVNDMAEIKRILATPPQNCEFFC